MLDAVLREDPYGRVACETLVNTGLIVVSGEITTETYVDIQHVARETVRGIGYDNAAFGFDCDTCAVVNAIDRQSPDIAQGVDAAYETRHDPLDDDRFDLAGAGDQGMMFGYATNETEELMPLPILLAHKLSKRLAEVRKADVLPYLRPDGKTQVTVRYRDGRPVAVEKILISTQHADGIDSETLIKPDLFEHVLRPVLPAELYEEKQLLRDFLVNPTGRFVIGGPMGDCGLTGRKIIVDTYGGMARHGGGAFSGKDPSKVDRSAAYAVQVGGEEHRGRRPRRSRGGAGGVRDRGRAPGVGDGRDVRHREARPRADHGAGERALRPAPRRVPRGAAGCTARSTRRPRRMATSAATTTTSRGSAPTRPRRCARRPGWGLPRGSKRSGAPSSVGECRVRSPKSSP